MKEQQAQLGCDQEQAAFDRENAAPDKVALKQLNDQL